MDLSGKEKELRAQQLGVEYFQKRIRQIVKNSALITFTVKTFGQNFAEWLHLCERVLCEGVLQDMQDVAAGFYGDGF
ncbi:MAG: hypothetical protein WCF65_02010 [Parachlamydiaceae bacterium]